MSYLINSSYIWKGNNKIKFTGGENEEFEFGVVDIHMSDQEIADIREWLRFSDSELLWNVYLVDHHSLDWSVPENS